MNMTITFDDFKVALILICVLSCCWSSYNSKYSDNKKIQAITSFWLGLMVYTVLFYIVFSWNK